MKEAHCDKHAIKIIVLCILWYIISSSNNVIGKLVLNEFPYPMTLTMVQLSSISLYSGPFFGFWKIRKSTKIPWKYYCKFILTLAFGKFLASLTSHISIWKVPVSYAHTVKATMPFFTVVLARILFNEKQSKVVYFSLIPIILGVGIATLTEISFDLVGLISALLSTMGFSLQNMYSKKVLKDTGVHHLRLLHMLGQLAFVMFFPIWLLYDAGSVFSHPVITNTDYRVISLIFLDGILNWMQNIVAFSVLSIVTPLTYAVASAAKRIFVIGISLVVLGNPVTLTNMFGMTIAVLGVLCYNRAKQLASIKSNGLLPTSKHDVLQKSFYNIYSNQHKNNINTKNLLQNTDVNNTKLLFV